MEVRMININGYPTANAGKTPEETAMNGMQSAAEPQPQKVKTDVPEKVMMDFKDVQTFLYLLIGSHIKIDENSARPGQAFDISAWCSENYYFNEVLN